MVIHPKFLDLGKSYMTVAMKCSLSGDINLFYQMGLVIIMNFHITC